MTRGSPRPGARARGTGLAGGLVAGVVLDRVFGDPRRYHPVAGFGRGAAALERRMWHDARLPGVAFTAVVVGAATVAGRGVERAALTRGGYPVAVAAATWAVLGGQSLRVESHALHALVSAGDLPAARRRLTHLVGRDTATLPAPEIARAVVESVAENSCDAVVAPLLWGAVAGLPGLLGYRAANTLDAMVGHRSPRYRRFGWAAARLDDLLNLVPSRVAAALVAVLSGRPRQVWAVTARDAPGHPSPNSGWPEAAFAAALRVRLGGRNDYAGRSEDRPVLGDGAAVTAADLPRAAALAGRLTAATALLAAALAWAARR